MSGARRRLGLSLALAVVLALGAMLLLRQYSARRLQRAVERFEAVAGSLDLASYAPPSLLIALLAGSATERLYLERLESLLLAVADCPRR